MKHATKTLAVIAALLAFSLSAMGQLTGPKAIPGDYASVAAAITDLNTQGVGAGGVTFNVAAGYTETLPSLTAGLITASGTVANPIVFQKSGAGADPLITAFSPGASTTVDYIIAIAGGDYITFDGIDLQENALNTTATMQMEWGYALVKASAITPFDGCQNVTIKNSTITLNKTNTSSTGIYTGNHVSTVTTSLTITATTDASNNCKFFSNTISNVNSGIKLNGFAASSPYALYDQNNEVGVSGANTITNFGGGSISPYGIYAVYQNNLKINNNTVNGGTGTTTTVYGIYTSTGTSSSVDINGNTVTLACAGTSSAMYGIYNGMGSTALGNTANINNNILQNCTYTTSTSATFYGIYNAASPATVNMIGNTVTGNVIPGTGTMYLLYGGSPTNLNMNNNTVTNNQKTGAGTLYCAYAGTAVVTFSGNNVTGNTGGSSIYGYYDASSPTVENIYNNRIAQLTATAASTIYGIYSNAISTTALAVYGNTVDSLVSAGGTIYGIYNAAGGTVNIYQNNLFRFVSNAAGSLVYGLYISSGADVRLYNNFVSDLQAPVATGTIAVNGIYISGGTIVGAYYNTVYLDAVSSSASTFGTSGIYASTTPTVDLRNNIVVNLSIPGPTGGFTVAHRRSTTTLTTYASASNSNDFYVNPGAGVQRYYYSDGTAAANCDSTFPAYKARVASRDGSSFAENPPFVNVATKPYDLHMQGTIPTQTESGGSPITSPLVITVDYDGTTRNAVTPDVGADEFVAPTLDLSPPVISYLPLGNTASTSNRSLASVTITDATGVNTTAGTRPRVYYKRITDANAYNDNTSGTAGWKYAEAAGGGGSPFSFTINYALLNGGTGVVVGDTVQYFVVAQDLTVGVNVGINSGTFAATPVSVALTSAAFPIGGTINGYAILGSISGTFTVGTAGTYPTITAAVADLNGKVMVGPVTFLLNDPTYPTETFPITINENGGSSGTNILTIKPNTGVTTTVSGVSTSSIFKLNGADYVTIDGSNAGTSSQNLTIANTGTASSTAAIWMTSLGAGLGATNNTIKNCILAGGANTSGVYGIAIGGSTVGSTGADNDNITIQNNSISKAYVGIWAQGSTTTNPGLMDNLQVIGNSLGSGTVADYLGHDGILVGNGTGGTLSQNTVYNIITSATTPVGITLSTGFVSSTVSRNKINNIIYTGTGGYGGRGFYVNTGSASSNLTLANNVIYQIGGDGWSSFSNSSMVGMYFDGTTGGLNIYFNSVYMSGIFTRATATLTTAILFNATTITGIDLRDNIFQNSMDNTGVTTDKNYAIYSTAPAGSFTNINRNDYWATGVEGVLGYLGADQTTLAAWQTATGQDANSINGDPAFFGVNDLRVYLGSPVLAAGVTIPGITIDYLGVTRGSPPSLGAYEVGLTAGKPNPALLVSPALGDTTVSIAATLNWTSGGGAPTGYKLSFGTDNPPTNILNNSDRGNVLTYDPSPDMAYNTTYYWKVVAYNANGDTTGTIWSFRTMPDPTIASFPYTQTFEAVAFPPAGWTNSGAKLWIRATSEVHTGTGAAKISYSPAGIGILNMPPVALPVQSSRIRFWWKDDDITDAPTIAGHDTTWFEISTNAGSTWTTLNILAAASPQTGYFEVVDTLTSYGGQTVYFRWRDWSDGLTAAYGTGVDDVVIEVDAPMVYTSSTTTQNTSDVVSGTTNQQVIGIQVVTNGALSPISATRFKLNANGTTSVSNISNARIFYTGTSSTFAAVNQFGSTVASPTITSYAVNGSQVLSPGTNYFWLTYDVSAGATVGNVIDAECDSVTVLTNQRPTVTAPAGSRTIKAALVAGDYTIGLTLFNRAIGKDLTFERSTRTVVRQIAVEPQNVVTAKDPVRDRQAMSPSSLATETRMVEMQEDYWTLSDHGRPYNGPTSVELTAADRERLGLSDRSLAIYPTITAALADLNNLGVAGPVRFILVDATYPTETYPLTINITAGAVPTAVNTVTIKPNTGVTATISGAMVSGAIFKIVNTNYITIDGSNTNGGTTRDLTITNTSTTGPSVIHIGSVGATPITNTTIKNCVLINGANTSSAVAVGGATVIGDTGYFSNTTLQNNSIQKAYIGAYINGGTGNGSNVSIIQNSLNTSGTNAIRYIGLYLQGVNGSLVSRNNIGNFDQATGEIDRGIWLATGNQNATVERNEIHDLKYPGTSGYGGKGVYISTAKSPANVVVANNFIYALNGDGDNYLTANVYNPAGIYAFTNQTGINIYFNSINLSGNTLNYTANSMSQGICIDTPTVANVRNNAIVNNLGLLGATGRGAVGVFARNASTIPTINYNDYYVNPTGGGIKAVGHLDTAASVTLTDWRTATGQEVNGVAGDPLFTSATDLHFTSGSPLSNAGTAIAGITVDFDGDTRNASTPDIGADESGSTTSTLNVAIASGWNLISNPVTNAVPGDSVRQLYPTSLNAYAFEFAAGYVQRFRLLNGKGYWEKFPAAISNAITGTLRTRDSISVVAGWNIIGTISNPVDTNTIVSVPPGLRISSWFGYAAGYTAVTQLVPGKGYWVKSSAAGKFVLANPLAGSPAKTQAPEANVLEALNTLTVTDSRGGSQTLYFGADAKNEIDLPMFVMPPAPPLGALDARFETAEGGSMVRTHAAKVSDAVEYSVAVQSDAYPLTVTWKINGGTASYELADGQGGRVFTAKEMTGEGSMKITSSEVNKFSVKLIGDGQLPADFALSQNYPNPFNPTTNIKYALPVDSKLTMDVYNVIGQRVRTLVNDVQVAGYHVAEWDGTGNGGQQLASGVYFLRLSALGNNGKSFNEVRKLMMLK